MRQAQDPLAHRHLGEDVIDELPARPSGGRRSVDRIRAPCLSDIEAREN